MRTALIADPSLESRAGHHYNAAKTLVEELVRHDFDVRLHVAIRTPDSLLQELGAKRTFRKRTYDRNDWSERGYRTYRRVFAKAMRDAILSGETLPDIIVLPGCDQLQLDGLAAIISSINTAWKPQIVALLVHPPRWDRQLDDKASLPQHEEYRRAFSALCAAVDGAGNIHFACETDAMLQTYEELAGFAGGRMDHPHAAAGLVRDEQAKPDHDRVHIVVTGQANLPKGYELLPDIIRQVTQANSGIGFTVHGDTSGTGNSNAAAQIKALTGLGSLVSVLTGSLDRGRYLGLLSSADIVLLPYDPVWYRFRGSGVFAEASALGIPIVAPAGPAFSDEAIKSGRAIGFKDHDAAAIGSAVLQAVAQLQKMRSLARQHIAGNAKTTSASVLVKNVASDVTQGMLKVRRRSVLAAKFFMQFRHWAGPRS